MTGYLRSGCYCKMTLGKDDFWCLKFRVHFQLCDSALAEVLRLLEVDTVVGVGKYAADRAKRVISQDEELKGIQGSFIIGWF